MKKQKETPDFKAVEFMRQRRDELSELYNSNPTEFQKRLDAVRKKYASKFHRKGKHAA